MSVSHRQRFAARALLTFVVGLVLNIPAAWIAAFRWGLSYSSSFVIGVLVAAASALAAAVGLDLLDDTIERSKYVDLTDMDDG